MTKMKFIKKVPASILGVGSFVPGKEYPLPDGVAAGLIATQDPDWAQVKAQKSNSDEISSSSGEGSRHKKEK